MIWVSTKRKKKKASQAKRLTKLATKGAKRVRKTARFVAASGTEKAKEAAQFVYKHRKKIMEAVELLAAVLGTASQVLGKPSKPSKASRRSRRK